MNVIAHQSTASAANSVPSSPDRQADPTTPESATSRLLGYPIFGKDGLFSWRIMGGVFASLLVIGWVFIVVILIQEEKWQLVLVAWLLLYAAAHFCYWYFKRHHLLSLHSQICRRMRGASNPSSVRPMDKPADAPPSYDDIIKSEHPPPAYCSVVLDTSKCSPKSLNKKFTLFSLEALPNVFGKSSPTHTACASTSRKHGIFRDDGRPVHPPSYSPTISGSISNDSPYRWGTQEQAGPPPYDQTCAVDVESQTIDGVQPSRVASSHAYRSSRSVLIIDNQPTDGSLTPILAPIHNNIEDRTDSPLPHMFCNNSESRAGSSYELINSDSCDERESHSHIYKNDPDNNLHNEVRRNSRNN